MTLQRLALLWATSLLSLFSVGPWRKIPGGRRMLVSMGSSCPLAQRCNLSLWLFNTLDMSLCIPRAGTGWVGGPGVPSRCPQSDRGTQVLGCPRAPRQGWATRPCALCRFRAHLMSPAGCGPPQLPARRCLVDGLTGS